MTWVISQNWLRTLAIWAAVVLTAFFFLFGFRRQGERFGELNERLRHVQNVERARSRMEEVPHPDRGDVLSRLRDGDF